MRGQQPKKPTPFRERRFVIPPRDHERGYPLARLAYEGLKAAISWGRANAFAIEVIIRLYLPGRSDKQQRTLWMWHGQVASELTLRTGKRWTKEDVHELIFLPRWMPKKELVIPDTGEIVERPYRTGDKIAPADFGVESMRELISKAMDQYLAWTINMGIEVTVPESGDW